MNIYPSALRDAAEPGEDPRMTTTEVARYLHVNDARVRKLCAEGVFKQVEMTPLGRLFDRAEVEVVHQARQRHTTR